MSVAVSIALPKHSAMDVRWLGRIELGAALRLQEAAVQEHERLGDTVLLLEHEPVYTTGRGGRSENLPRPEPGAIPVVRLGRGGDATYHGPGQLVAYVHVDLRRRGSDVHRFLRALEETVIRTLEAFGVAGMRVAGKTGVWVLDDAPTERERGATTGLETPGGALRSARKIASVGIAVRRGITMHGLALNVTGDLSPFAAIVPCGLPGVAMTSIAAEKPAVAPTVEEVAEVAARVLPLALDAICPVVFAAGKMEAP